MKTWIQFRILLLEMNSKIFKKSLLPFLKENSEFRRELFICDFSKEDVVIGFKNERIDGKIVKARIDAQTRTWTFELVEGGGAE